MTAGLLALTFTVAAPPPVGLEPGDELRFVGTVSEVVRRPPNFFQRDHALELRVLVFDRQEKWADIAVLTLLQRRQDAVGGAVGVVTGSDADKDALPSVRLDLIRVHADGSVHLLAPNGPLPLKLNADTPARVLPPIPLDSFAAAEFGIFPPRPPQNNAGDSWAITHSDRANETWQAKGSEFVNAERCELMLMNQASANWAKPIGGQTAWQRADAVWVSTQDGTARKVHRVIRHRDGIETEPAAWVEVKYQLKDQGQLSGRTFERARRDAELAYMALTDAATLAPDAVRLGPKLFEAKLAKLDAQLEETDRSSPYREAMLAARRTFEDARQGKGIPIQPVTASIGAPLATPTRPRWPEAGQTAPDLLTGNFRLAEHRGKPVLLVFFKPGGETAPLALAIAGAIEKRYGGKILVAPLAVFGTVANGKADRDRLKLTFPILDGSKASTTYGVETAPRFALIDSTGKVRWEFTGVGAETGFLLKEQADHLVAPVSPAGLTGTPAATVPVLPPIVPRP